ncbi:hypothetical protein DFH09DRAFT_1450478 [Mycena vulgaris]|nr:hypothetical protein DFH09DRAFT_1450478 [Mycena vulgaris]
MDELPFEVELHSESTTDEDGPRNDQYTGAFFSKAQHLVVAGGKFKSITNITHAGPTVPSDFRMIPMGDLDLRHEIRLDSGSGVVHYQHGRKSARRVYSARIHGSKSKMTVVIYQGENAEEDISRTSWLRHPNFVQLYATASSSGVHATIFHDDLVPATQILAEYHGSHFSMIYLYHYLDTEFDDVGRYMYSIFKRGLHSADCTLLIRCSTGQLCVDITFPGSAWLWLDGSIPSSPASYSSKPPEDSQIIESTPLDVYHEICSVHLADYRKIQVSPDASVQLGAIISCAPGTGVEHSKVIADIPEHMFRDFGWSETHGAELLVMEDGWTRGHSSNIPHEVLHRTIYCDPDHFSPARSWIGQANYVFNRLQNISNYADYVFVEHIRYSIALPVTGSIPAAYLFLCPLQDFHADIPLHFWRPECPAYWSLDLSGAERLSTEEAEGLGFPRLELKMELWGSSWDETVYTGIREFHKGKGYDPYSQDVARALGYALFQVSSELDGLFAHVQDLTEEDESEQDKELTVNNCPQGQQRAPPFQASSERDGPFAHVQDLGEDDSSDNLKEEDTSSNGFPKHPVPNGTFEPSEAFPTVSFTYADSSLTRGIFHTLDDEEIELSRNWKIIMRVQFALILTLGIVYLYDCSLAYLDLTSAHRSPD